MSLRAVFAISMLVLAGCAAERHATELPPPAPAPSGPEPIDRALPALEAYVDHQSVLALDAAQLEQLRAESQRAQAALVDLEWQLGAAHERLATFVEAPGALDEARTLELAGEVVALERAIKLEQLSLRVRLRNVLRDEQRARLAELRAPR